MTLPVMMEEPMSDSRPTTQGSKWILTYRPLLSSNIPDRWEQAGDSRKRPYTACILLILFVIGVFSATGCELLPEMGMEDAAAMPEEAAPLSETSGAVVSSEVLPIEEASEWPWLDPGSVIADPQGGQIVDYGTGEFLGRFGFSRDETFVEVLRAGDRFPLRFPLRGPLGASEPAELLNRYGRPIATISEMPDGRFLVKEFNELERPLTNEPPIVPVAGGRRGHEKACAPLSGSPNIVECADSRGVIHLMNVH